MLSNYLNYLNYLKQIQFSLPDKSPATTQQIAICRWKYRQIAAEFVLYCTVLYCTVLYCTVRYCTVLYCTVLYCTVLYCTVLYCYYYYYYIFHDKHNSVQGSRYYEVLSCHWIFSHGCMCKSVHYNQCITVSALQSVHYSQYITISAAEAISRGSKETVPRLFFSPDIYEAQQVTH